MTQLLEFAQWDAAGEEAVWLVGRPEGAFRNRVVARWSLDEPVAEWYRCGGWPVVRDGRQTSRLVTVLCTPDNANLVEVEPWDSGTDVQRLASFLPPQVELSPAAERSRQDGGFVQIVSQFAWSKDQRWLAASSLHEGWVAIWSREDDQPENYRLQWWSPAPLPVYCALTTVNGLLYAVFLPEPRRLVCVQVQPEQQRIWALRLRPTVKVAVTGRWVASVDVAGELQVFELTNGGPKRLATLQLTPGADYQLAPLREQLLATASDGQVWLLRLPDLKSLWHGRVKPSRPSYPLFDADGVPHVLVETETGGFELFRLPHWERRATLPQEATKGFLTEPTIYRPGFLQLIGSPLQVVLPGAWWRTKAKGIERTGYGTFLPPTLQWLTPSGEGTYRCLRWFDIDTKGPAIVEIRPLQGEVVRRPLPAQGPYVWLATRPHQGPDHTGCHFLLVDSSREQISVLNMNEQQQIQPIGPPRQVATEPTSAEKKSVSAVWLPGHRLLYAFTNVRGLPAQRISVDLALWELKGQSWELTEQWDPIDVTFFEPLLGPSFPLPHPPAAPIGEQRFVVALPDGLRVFDIATASSRLLRTPGVPSGLAGPLFQHMHSLITSAQERSIVATVLVRHRGPTLPHANFLRLRSLLLALIENRREHATRPLSYQLLIWHVGKGTMHALHLQRPARAVRLSADGRFLAVWYDGKNGRQEVDLWQLEETPQH